MAEQRQKVVDELISTEKVYLQDLQLCVKYFFHELKKQKVHLRIQLGWSSLRGRMKNLFIYLRPCWVLTRYFLPLDGKHSYLILCDFGWSFRMSNAFLFIFPRYLNFV